MVAAVQNIPPPNLPTPASTPRPASTPGEQAPTPLSPQHITQEEEPGAGGQANQHENNVVDPHDQRPPDVDDQHENPIDPHNQSLPVATQEPSHGGRPSNQVHVEDADDSGDEQTCDYSQRSANLDVWPPFDHNNNTDGQDAPRDEQPSGQTVTSSIRHQLDTTQRASKRKQNFEDGRASKRAHIELADAVEGGPESSNTDCPTRWTYEEFAQRYYMLVPLSSWTSEIRDLANKILTKSLGAGSSHDLDKDGTTILFRAGVLAFLENLRTNRLSDCAIMIQKNLKAKYYRRKYLEARNAILLIQSIARGYLARKHAQETRKVRAATTIQRVWRGHKQRNNFNTIRNSVILAQAAAKGFLRRGEIMDTLVRSAVVLIQRAWRSRRQMNSWRQYWRKVVIIQSLWRGKRTRRLLSSERKPSAAVSPADEGGDGWTLSRALRSSLERIECMKGREYAQDFCHRTRFPNFTIQLRPEQDALEQSGGPQIIPAPDRRVNKLRFLIQDVDKKGKSIDKSVKPAKIVLQVLKRVHLVELTAKFEAEKAMPKKKGQPSVRDRYTDLLFPETIKYKRKKASRGGKGKEVKKGKEVSEELRKQEKEREKERKKKRNQAKKTLDYWTIGLGEPLRRMAERFGNGILLRLPADVTESR